MARVNEAQNFIRSNLAEDLRLDKVSQIAHSSPFHFHRIFKAISGETLATFTRRARLERAAYLMKSSPERNLSSIALEVGFPAVAEFSRVFKRQYGISPSMWDRTSYLQTDPACSQNGSAHVGDRQEFEVRIIRHNACRLAYVRMQTWFEVEKLKVGFEKLTRWLEERGIPWTDLELVGMSWDNYQTTPLDRIRYDLAFPVPDHIVGDHEIGVYALPAFQAAEVHCVGELGVVARAWDYLYDDWLANAAYEPKDLPAMKRFNRRPDELGWEMWDLNCSIALEPALP